MATTKPPTYEEMILSRRMVMSLRQELDDFQVEHRRCVKPVPGSYVLRIPTVLVSAFAYMSFLVLVACVYMPVAFVMPVIRCKMLHEAAAFLMVASLGGALAATFFIFAWLVYQSNRDQFPCTPKFVPAPAADAATPKAHTE
jgi:cytochrome bd-type quinol oxidase subunit 1